MKTSTNNTAFAMLVVALSLSITNGCRKTEEKTNTEDVGYASDQALAEKIFDDARAMADKGAGVSGSGAFKTSSCGTVTHSGSSFVIDFGATNCECIDGRMRRGKIIVHYTGAYADSGSVRTITFDNYYQNDNKVEGTKTVENKGHNSSGQPWFAITVDGTISKADGTVLRTNWTRTRTWREGYNTPINWTDDVYTVSGSGTITRPAGVVDVSIETANPLVIALNCRWIKAGSVYYVLPSGATRILNYGSVPNCDNEAQVILPTGTTIDITLP